MAENPRVLSFSDENEHLAIMPGSPILEKTPPPALFIGLGGSGTQIVGLLADRITDIFGNGDPAKVPSSFQFLCIDTNPRAATLVNNTRVHFMATEPVNGDEALRNTFPGMYEDCWPRPYLPGMIDDGAHQVRAVGHLAFMWQCNRDWDRVQGIYQDLQAATQPHLPRPVVCVFGSMCGGTGAGMAMDVAYLSAWMLRDTQPDIVGAFLGPRAFSDITMGDSPISIKANAYAFLKEVDHFSDHSDYPLHHLESSRLPGISVAQLDYTHPFGLLYYIDSVDDSGRLVGKGRAGREKLCGLVAEHFLSQYLGFQAYAEDDRRSRQAAGEEACVASFLDNYPQSFVRDAQTGAMPILSSLGLTTYVYPRRRIEYYSVHRWSRAVLHEMLQPRAAAGFDADAAADAFLLGCDIQEHGSDRFIDDLTALDATSALGRSVYATAGSDLVEDPVSDTPSRVATFHNGLMSDLESAEKQVTKRADAALQRVLESLPQWCSRMCSVTTGGGVHGLIGALDELLGQLQLCSNEMTAELEGSAHPDENRAASVGLRSRLCDLDSDDESDPGEVQYAIKQIKTSSALRQWVFWPNHDGTISAAEQYLKACAEMVETRLDIRAREEAIRVYDRVAEEVIALRSAALQLASKLGEWARTCVRNAAKALLAGAGEEAGIEKQYRHVRFALDGDGIEALYRNFLGREMKGSVDEAVARSAASVEAAIGSVWRSVRFDEDARQYVVALDQGGAGLDGAIEKQAHTELADLLAKDLMSALGPVTLAERAEEMALDCQPLWQLNETALSQDELNQVVPMAFLLVPGTGTDWDGVVQAVQRGLTGAPVHAVATGDPDRIILARGAFGAPIRGITQAHGWYQLYRKQLDSIAVWQRQNDASARMTIKPPHLCRSWAEFPEPLGDAAKGAEEQFALAMVTPVPAQLRIVGAQPGEARTILNVAGANMGGHYYLHPCPSGHRPVQPVHLGQGLLNAYARFRNSPADIQAVDEWFGDPGTGASSRVRCIGNDRLAEAMRPGLQRLTDWVANLDTQDPDYQAKQELLNEMIDAATSYMKNKLGAVV